MVLETYYSSHYFTALQEINFLNLAILFTYYS